MGEFGKGERRQTFSREALRKLREDAKAESSEESLEPPVQSEGPLTPEAHQAFLASEKGVSDPDKSGIHDVAALIKKLDADNQE